MGERLALYPLKNEYKFPMTASGPMFESVQTKADSIVVKFTNTVEGLVVGKSKVGEVNESKNDTLFGFELVDKEGVWHPANASIKDGSVVVSKSGLNNPKAVRYACHPVAPQGRQWNLYNKFKNKAWLPASPFCSDWSLMEYDPSKNPMPK